MGCDSTDHNRKTGNFAVNSLSYDSGFAVSHFLLKLIETNEQLALTNNCVADQAGHHYFLIICQMFAH